MERTILLFSVEIETIRFLNHFLINWFCFLISSGKWTNHKGRSRRFTNPEELEEQRKREEQERRWKKNNRGDDESSSEEEEKPATKGDKSNSEDETESESESEEESDDVIIIPIIIDIVK